MLILASTSPIRRQILEQAGLMIEVVLPGVDEITLRSRLPSELSPRQIAEALAMAKAEAVSQHHHRDHVIGADQLLVLDGEIFGKPESVEAAGRQLQRLRGRTHVLLSAVAVSAAGRTVWTTVEEAQLTMRNFSDAFLNDYLAGPDSEFLGSVGAYRLEAQGVQLFERIAGDYFTILGLPLLPLLEFLRRAGVTPS